MSLELWLAFVAASAVLLVIPGPTVLTVISYAVVQGRRASPSLVLGVALGDSTALAVSVIGLGALLAASAFAFAIIKIAGGVYLVYLGVKMLRAGVSVTQIAAHSAPSSRRRVFLNTYLVTASNPKSIIFFVAFLPQFVSPAGPVAQQLWLLAITFVTMAALNASMYSLAAASANRLLSSPRGGRPLGLVGGSLLCAAGVWALFARHGA